MRILILTALFIAPVYYFYQKEDVPKNSQRIDMVRVKMAGPRRPAVTKVTPAPQEERVQEEVEEQRAPLETQSFSEEIIPQDVTYSDIEEGWSEALLEFLDRVEPEDAQKIHKAYLAEQEAYQAETDALLNEKHQKITFEEVQELEQAIIYLEEAHQGALREILGAHYEAVRDHYEYYMDSVEFEE